MVDVIGRAKVIVESQIDKSSLDQTGGKIGSSLKKGAVIGVAALGTLAAAGVKSYLAFEQAEAQSRKLTNVLDNMGKSQAGPAVENLADSLMRMTGVDDEVIKQGQTILATFSNVAESAGEVGGSFERATKAAVDMSSAGFGSVESASVMLGKALQDPLKGITALGRAGVTFTEEQKALIEGFIEANDVISAQDLILKEVEKQVGGTAEASVTESAKISAAWGEVQEAVGQALSELTGGEVGTFSEALFKMADAIENLAESEGWKETGKKLRALNTSLQDSDTFLGQWAESNKEAVEGLGALLDALSRNLPTLRDRLSDHGRLWSDFGNKIGGVIDNVIDDIKDYIRWQSSIGDPITGDDVPDAPDQSQPRSTRAFGGPASGLTLVGERGPELLQLPAGSYVHNNNATRSMVAAANGDTINQTYIFNGPGSLSEARRQGDWDRQYGTRFGAATSAGAL